MNRTQKTDKNQIINFQSCFHAVSLPVCTSSRRKYSLGSTYFNRTITHSILGYLASVYSMFTCLSVDRYYQQEVDALPSNPSFGLCFAAFFGLFCCRPTSKRENNNSRFSHFHVVLAHHSGHSSLNK